MLDRSSDLHFPADRDVQHVFLNLSAICMSSLEKHPVRASPHFLIGFSWFAFLLSCVRVLKKYIVGYKASVVQYRTFQVVQ